MKKGIQDEYVTCPYNKGHNMPSMKLKWHLVKCKAKKERDELGLAEYHCKMNWMHIFFTKEELLDHEKQCEKACEQRKQDKIEAQHEWNQILQNPNENADDLKVYRADQEVDRKRSNCFLDDFKIAKKVDKIEKWDSDEDC